MNDELQGVLAELARGVGTTTGELWSWMQGDGIEAYAAANVAKLWPQAICFSLLTLLILAVIVYIFVKVSNDKRFDEVDILLFLLIPCIFLFLAGAAAICTVSELAGWLASPQGMVISMLLDKIGG